MNMKNIFSSDEKKMLTLALINEFKKAGLSEFLDRKGEAKNNHLDKKLFSQLSAGYHIEVI